MPDGTRVHLARAGEPSPNGPRNATGRSGTPQRNREQGQRTAPSQVRSLVVSARIQVRSVAKSFGSLDALAPVDLEVGDGETVTLLGPSGCGKTTLLRLIAGIEQPSSGEIVVNGMPPIEAATPQADRLRAPVTGVAPVAHRGSERPPAARHQPTSFAGDAERIGRRSARRSRPRRLPRRVPARALRRDATTGRPGAGLRHRRTDPADGRTVRRTRRDDPNRHAPPPRPAVRTARHHGACSSPTRSRKRPSCPIAWP